MVCSAHKSESQSPSSARSTHAGPQHSGFKSRWARCPTVDLMETLERFDRLKISTPPKKTRHPSGRSSPSILLARRAKAAAMGLSVEPDLASDFHAPMPLAPRSGEGAKSLCLGPEETRYFPSM
mmetsp:Transcript_46642/g.93396  ORF Transcript_46642/g.93396 Transcript_46642/m.93396 type:complete len:124 (+) Transcript_46642:122-493(+)